MQQERRAGGPLYGGVGKGGSDRYICARLGQHTDALLTGLLGLSDGEIAELRQKWVTWGPAGAAGTREGGRARY